MGIGKIIAVIAVALLPLGAVAAVFPPDTLAEAGKVGKAKDRKEKEEPADSLKKKPPVKKKSEYEKFLETVKDSTEQGFISLYRTDKDKIFIGYPRKYLGRRILVAGTIKSVSDPAAVNVGYKYSAPLCIGIQVDDSLLVMTEPLVNATTGDREMETAMARNYVSPVYRRQKVACFNRDSSVFFFDATVLVNEQMPKGNGFAEEKGSPENQTSYFGAMKAFADNASIVLHRNVSFHQSVLGVKIPLGKGTMSASVSFLLLPEDKMRPRIQDSRVGIFSTAGMRNQAKYELTHADDGFRPYRMANRWRLEPADTAAWLRGEPVKVKRPIVWYVDDAFPESWKRPVREGILAWNEAFRKIGLEDVMEVRDFPTAAEDPEFDPDNLKYSCIRYIPNATMNAMGPSWVDPETGEILNASVLVYNDVIRLINNWRFVQTAQVDERVRARKMPQEVIDESLVYVISHEIGHTLGLMHNMSASAAIPVDSLRSATFTAQHGTTASIMDYARFNYVAQPEDKGVRLTPPSLGVYDEYAIAWLYKPVPAAKDMWEEAEIAGRDIDAHAGDPFYRYGAQHVGNSSNDYDPSALSEDLGDDPVKAGEYGIRNLKYILPRVNGWISDDPDYSHRQRLYTQLAAQYNRYLNNALGQVGGIYLSKVKEGTEGVAVEPVSHDRQKESLKWVVDQVRNSSWLNDWELTGPFPVHTPVSNTISLNLAKAMAGTVPKNVMLASVNSGGSSTYTIREYYNDLFRQVFKRSRMSAGLTSEEKTLQRNLVTLTAASSVSKSARKFAIAEEDTLPEKLFEEHDFCCGFGEQDQAYPRALSVTEIDETGAYNEVFLEKVRRLAKRCRLTAPARDKAHYEYLYKTAKAASGK